MIDPSGIKIGAQKKLPETQLIVETKSPVNSALSDPLDSAGFPHLRTKKDGSVKPKSTIENVEYLLVGYGITSSYDPISKEINVQIPGLSITSDNYHNAVIETINSLASLNEIPITQVSKYVAVIAYRNPINPVANWITGRPWDGNDRLPDICDTLTTADDYPIGFKNLLLIKWLLSAVAAATSPNGFHGRGILTLQGPQGSGKTSWVRSLVPDDILRDKVVLTGHHLDPANKDSVTTAVSHWLVEIGELDSSFKKDIARLKGFITQDKDKVRRPYARADSEYQRRTVFCATVNEVNFLIDKTGNSRFWVIPVTGIDFCHGTDMQQVFAQLYLSLNDGATWWLTAEEEKKLEELNQDHKAVSVLEETLLKVFDMNLDPDKWSRLSATEVLQSIGYERPTNPQCRECGGILREHFGSPKKSHGITKWKVPINDRQFPGMG